MSALRIVKIGGNVIDSPTLSTQFLKSLSLWQGPQILVHGGGKLATDLANRMQIPVQMVEGRRITDDETLRVVTMVYAGWVNKTLVAQLNALGIRALGLSGADGQAILTRKRQHPQIDYGWVGDLEAVNTSFFEGLLAQGLLPVVAPITADAQGQLLNTNADTIAQSLATALAASHEVELVYCFEKAGVLRDIDQPESLIEEIRPEIYSQLKAEGIIHSGMVPKLDNAFAALQAGVRQVRITSAEALPTVSGQVSGTRILA